MIHSFDDLRSHAEQNPPAIAVILGSGLGDIANRLQVTCQVSYAGIPQMPSTSVAGHAGKLLYGRLAEQFILIFQGRFHRYEGHDWDTILRPVRIAYELGALNLLATNAAGGIRDDLHPGNLLALTATIDITGQKAWRHEEPNSHVFNKELTAKLQQTASALSIPLPTGVYAQVLGPCYETPAEIRAFRTWGADAVGMSTAREVRFAYTLGMRCVGLSLITNRAAGLSKGPLSHDEVLETAVKRKMVLIDLVEKFVEGIG